MWGHAEEGATQGDPEAGTFFCAAWHPQICELDRLISLSGGAARAGMDDLFVVGPAEVVFPALETLWHEVENLLKLERQATRVHPSRPGTDRVHCWWTVSARVHTHWITRICQTSASNEST